jgi:hypothetical protein
MAEAAVLLDQLVDVIAALAVALGAFDAEHVELAFDVTENEISAGHLLSKTSGAPSETGTQEIAPGGPSHCPWPC